MGLDGATLSCELNLNQIREMGKFPDFVEEVLVYGRIPLMISEYCPVGSIKGNFGKTPDAACLAKTRFLPCGQNEHEISRPVRQD